jgi:hypothetical protein
VDDSFDVSLSGLALAMPTLPGRRKGGSTQKLYLYHVRRLAAWARLRGHEGFATLTKQELRAYLATLVSRSGDEASTAYKSSVLDAIKCLYVYLEEDEDSPDIAGKLSVGSPLESDRIAHLDAPEVDRLLSACLDERDRAVISVLLVACGSASWRPSTSPRHRRTSPPCACWSGARAARSAPCPTARTPPAPCAGISRAGRRASTRTSPRCGSGGAGSCTRRAWTR